MDENVGRITQEIAAERHDLGRNVHELEARARELGDWRAYYRRHPALMLGLALGGGVALGAISAREPQSRPSQLADTWRHLSDALLGLATAEVMNFVGEIVPGFSRDARSASAGSTVSDDASTPRAF